MYVGNLQKLQSILSKQHPSRAASPSNRPNVQEEMPPHPPLDSTSPQQDPLQKELTRLAQREKLLKRLLASQIRHSLDFNTILQTAINEVRQLLRVECCQFLWHHPEKEKHQFEPVRKICQLKQVCSGCAAPKTSVLDILGDTLLARKLLRIDNTANDPLLDRARRDALCQAKGIKSLLAVTFRTQSGEIGVVLCEHRKRQHTWRDDEVELLADLADQLAIAIDRARLYEQSRVAAATAQAQATQMKQALDELAATQAQLIQTEKMSSLGLLVAGVAHEINNPVNFIHGNLNYANQYTDSVLNLLELYQKHYPEPVAEIQQFSETIELDFIRDDLPKLMSSMEMGTHRIQEIVRSLRHFSHADEKNIQPADLHEGLDSTLSILQNRLKAKGHRPEIEVVREYGNLPAVECSIGQLNQVFMNILGNAIDAVEESMQSVQKAGERPQITVKTEVLSRSPQLTTAAQIARTESTMHPVPWIAISIIDNGSGIGEEARSHLFDPFFTTKPVGKGTGLGLSISYQIIVEKHHGKLECLSTPGRGSEFRIFIPAVQKTLNRQKSTANHQLNAAN
ncbi:MAG: ATP-binding protein [Cyanobacteriota bacterium]|nr:ATP-binding protein [Cyanobacteriota bacterium]